MKMLLVKVIGFLYTVTFAVQLRSFKLQEHRNWPKKRGFFHFPRRDSRGIDLHKTLNVKVTALIKIQLFFNEYFIQNQFFAN